ncbi:MAG: hypothetical protein U1E05_22110 [Patescibacteria group bacterium]|nr:hypothetical protein [Patescibacteria group bacterium]
MKRPAQQAVHALAAMAVLVHLWGGCCLHHAHAGDASDRLAVGNAAGRDTTCCCPCGRAEAADGTSHHKGMPPQGCGEGHCIFAIPGSSSAGAAPELPNVPMAGSSAVGIAVARLPDSGQAGRIDPGEADPPPLGGLRPHLLKQVLLL